MEVVQTSFKGGMNLLVDDTRMSYNLTTSDGTENSNSTLLNQYRLLFNARSRYDIIEPIKSSYEDPSCPKGLKQGILTFGNYLIIFIAGRAWWRPIGQLGWRIIADFGMSKTAPRYWFCEVPVSETNYARVGVTTNEEQAEDNTTTNPNEGISLVDVEGASGGNLPGLLVQDGINQPQFIFLNESTGYPVVRITQNYDQWDLQWISDLDADDYGTVTLDAREYVPIGTSMDIYNGMLCVLSTDGYSILRSVQGRPLDFVVNVDTNGYKGGDATTTSYTVGVRKLNCIKTVSSGLLCSGGNSCILVTLNQTQDAPTLFGQYTFNRQFLFTGQVLSDRAIIDINGDTAFVDYDGLRTFNSIQQMQNEGRNSVFTKTISSLFKNITQTSDTVCCTFFDNYSIFCVNTVYGYVLIVYDTINQVFASIDDKQIGAYGLKQFANINTDVTQLYAITGDDRFIQLYCGGKTGTKKDEAVIRFLSVCSQNPSVEIKHKEFRAVFTDMEEDFDCSLETVVDNRLSVASATKTMKTSNAPLKAITPTFDDYGKDVTNVFWSTPNCASGWKVYNVLRWTSGAKLTNVSTTTLNAKPINPLKSQTIS